MPLYVIIKSGRKISLPNGKVKLSDDSLRVMNENQAYVIKKQPRNVAAIMKNELSISKSFV